MSSEAYISVLTERQSIGVFSRCGFCLWRLCGGCPRVRGDNLSVDDKVCTAAFNLGEGRAQGVVVIVIFGRGG